MKTGYSSRTLISSSGLTIVSNPRMTEEFDNALDNLTPVMTLDEIVFVRLGTKEQNVGILQFINKINGCVQNDTTEIVGLLLILGITWRHWKYPWKSC